MASELKSTGSGNLFVIFGEPDIELLTAHPTGDGAEQFCVKLRGIDVFDPATGDIRSDEPDSVACWFVDTNYDHESFFVRHAYFLGANDPYKSLKTTLKAEIDEDAWSSLHSDLSRPFPAPEKCHSCAADWPVPSARRSTGTVVWSRSSDGETDARRGG